MWMPHSAPQPGLLVAVAVTERIVRIIGIRYQHLQHGIKAIAAGRRQVGKVAADPFWSMPTGEEVHILPATQSPACDDARILSDSALGMWVIETMPQLLASPTHQIGRESR